MSNLYSSNSRLIKCSPYQEMNSKKKMYVLGALRNQPLKTFNQVAVEVCCPSKNIQPISININLLSLIEAYINNQANYLFTFMTKNKTEMMFTLPIVSSFPVDGTNDEILDNFLLNYRFMLTFYLRLINRLVKVMLSYTNDLTIKTSPTYIICDPISSRVIINSFYGNFLDQIALNISS